MQIRSSSFRRHALGGTALGVALALLAPRGASATVLTTGDATATLGFGGAIIAGNTGVGSVSFSAGAVEGSIASVVGGVAPTGDGTIVVDGAGTMLTIQIDNTGAPPYPLHLEIGAQGTGRLAVTNGATFNSQRLLAGTTYQGPVSAAIARSAGATGSVTVDGTGSLFRLDSNLVIAGGEGGGASPSTGALEVRAGGHAQMLGVTLGANSGATGSISLDGGSLYVGAQSVHEGPGGGVTVGANGGQGSITAANGATVHNEVQHTVDDAPHVGLRIGGGGSAGTVNVLSGSSWRDYAERLVVDGAGGAAGQASALYVEGASYTLGYFAPSDVEIARTGVAEVNIGAGGQFAIEGVIGPTIAPRITIGGERGAASSVEAHGALNVSGAGAQATIRSDTGLIDVGAGGASARGELSITGGGSVRGVDDNGLVFMNVGAGGAEGVVTVSGADVNGIRSELRLQGAGSAFAEIFGGASFTGTAGRGAFLTLGADGGSGALNVLQGGQVSVSDFTTFMVAPATVGAGIDVGKTAGSSGAIVISGAGSVLTVEGTRGLETVVSIGRSGAGSLTLDDGGVLSMQGGNGAVLVGAEAGGSGTVLVDNQSLLQAGRLLGIGHDGNANTGTGVVTVRSGSTIVADDIIIGVNGTLDGNGTIQGHVTNYGTINPGNSPGTLRIEGNYTNAGGTIVLEIQSDGAGGFLHDTIVFDTGVALDFTGLNIVFAFLGGTDPNAAVGDMSDAFEFQLDTFFRVAGAGGDAGISSLLDPGETLNDLFAGVMYDATATDAPIYAFNFDPNTGGTVSTEPTTETPEPAMLGLLGLGLIGLASLRRRRAA